MLKNFVYLTIFTTFIVIVWIGVTIYHNISTTTISEVAQIQIAPINPTFNKATIANLKKRKQIEADLSRSITVVTDENLTPSASDSATQSLIENVTTPSTSTGGF